MGMNDALFEQFANELLFEEELAPKTVKDILVVVRSILDYTGKHKNDDAVDNAVKQKNHKAQNTENRAEDAKEPGR